MSPLKGYEGVLQHYYVYHGYVYFQCQRKHFSKAHIASALPICFQLPVEKVDLAKLKKNVPIRWFFREFHHGKVRVEVKHNGEWIPVYDRYRRSREYE